MTYTAPTHPRTDFDLSPCINNAAIRVAALTPAAPVAPKPAALPRETSKEKGARLLATMTPATWREVADGDTLYIFVRSNSRPDREHLMTVSGGSVTCNCEAGFKGVNCYHCEMYQLAAGTGQDAIEAVGMVPPSTPPAPVRDDAATGVSCVCGAMLLRRVREGVVEHYCTRVWADGTVCQYRNVVAVWPGSSVADETTSVALCAA